MRLINLIEEGRLGGPQLRILRVTPHLLAHGVESTVVLPQKNSSDFQDCLTKAGIPFRTSPLTTLQKHPKRLLAYALKFDPELYHLTRIIRELNPDLVHVSGGSWQIKGVLAGRLSGRKVIWHLNDTQTPKVLKLLFRAIQPLAHAFITAGYRVQKYYLPNEKRRPIFNISAPVDCSVFDPALVQKTGSDDVWRIVTVANINPIKGLEVFLEVAAILNKKVNKPLEFRIIGLVHDSQRKYFETLKILEKKLNMHNLVFVGGVEDVRKELSSADIYVCTSHAEASPTTLWEAMAMGKPIVTTDVGEVDYIIEDGVSGFLTPVGDADEIAGKILFLLNHPIESETMGNKARQTALDKLDVSIIARQHAHAYQRC